MRDDNLDDLPTWHDDFDEDEDEGELWKPNPTRDACKALYEQWSSVMSMLNSCFKPNEDATTDNSWIADHQEMVIGDAFLVGAKIRSSESGGIYVLRMENAAIIRKNAQSVQSSMLLFMEDGVISNEYGEIIRHEIEVFKNLFREWVATFEKDEYTDEWGLFV